MMWEYIFKAWIVFGCFVTVLDAMALFAALFFKDYAKAIFYLIAFIICLLVTVGFVLLKDIREKV